MGQARRWASVALVGLVAACLYGAAPDPARAEEEVLDWKVTGAIDVGGMYRFGTNLGSPKLDNYRDMDNGFLGELELKAEKKDSPYFFELYAKNPARDDQMYEGAFGRYGMFRLDLDWDRTPVVLSNTGQTIYQMRGDTFTLPAASWSTLVTNYTGLTPVTLPLNAAVSAKVANIQSTLNGMLQPVSLGYNTDVAHTGFKYTPFEDLQFDIDYSNIRREGRRPLGTVTGSPGGAITELAIPIENYTNEVKFGAEYARQAWGLRFNYIGSFFNNDYTGYTWANPIANTNTASVASTSRISAAPDNSSNSFSLTGTAALPLQSRINGTFAYTMLRQNQTFEPNTLNPLMTQRSTDDAGNGSADSQANLIMGNVVLTSRPINNVTATVRYRYFDYQNDTPSHSFSFMYPEGSQSAPETGTTPLERYTKQNTGIDIGWRPFRVLSFKAGYEYEHWNRGDYESQSFSDSENIGKIAMDVTPVDWFLGRVTYTYGDRTVSGYVDPGLTTPVTGLPQAIKYNYAPRTRNKVDVLLQFSPWETLVPSITGGYANDDYSQNQYGLLNDDYWTAGVNLDWTPLKWLTISGDYSYEQYNYSQTNRYYSTAPGIAANDWNSQSRDEFHNLGVNATFDIVPKKFSIVLGYNANFGYTTTKNASTNFVAGAVTPPATAVNAIGYYWDKVFNVTQTFKFVAKYFLTEKLSLRGGFAYERYSEKDYAKDPMQPFMGLYEVSYTQAGAQTLNAGGIQSTYLGATSPGYETYILSAFVRYEF